MRPLERDFVDRPSGRDAATSKVESRPSIKKAAADAETRIEPDASEVRLAAPLPCPPGKSPFRIKGMPYRGLLHLVTKALPGGLDAFCASLEDERLRAFVRQPFLATARYDILPFLPLSLALARAFGLPFDDFVRRCAEGQSRYDARTVFKAMWANATIAGIADRISRFGAQYYDFGKFTGEVPEPNMLAIVHAGVPAYVYPWYAPMHVAYTEECARMLGATDLVSSTQDSPCTPARATGSRS